MKKLLWTIFVLTILLIFTGLTSCLETGDEERPGLAISSELLLTKVWEVDMFKDDGQNKTGLFNNIFLEFRPNFVFRITHGCDIVDGEWIVSSDSTLLVIRLPDSPEPLNQLEDEWVITWSSDTEIHLIEQDNKGDEEFHLKVAPLQSLNCQSCVQLSDALTESDWSITSFSTLSQQYTEDSRGGYLDFNKSGEVVFYHDGDEVVGSWALTDQCHTLVIQWFEDNADSDLYIQLEDHWFISGNDPNVIVLETDEPGRLELSKGRVPDCTDLHTSMINTSWSIDFVSINGDNVSDSFLGTGFTLLENNQLATEVFIGPAVLGEWLLSGTCNLLTLHIQAGQLKELGREWTITEITDDQIILSFEEGALSMQMKLRKGQPEPSSACLELLDHLKYKKWSLEKYTENGSVVHAEIQGYTLEFKEDGRLVVHDNQNELVGRWYPAMNCDRMVIDFEDQDPANKLNGKWKIQKLDSKEIILVYEKMDTKRTIELVAS